MKVGFIGLGIMGNPMAANLIAAKHTVNLFSRSGVPANLAEAGGIGCGSCRELAGKSDVIITMLPDTPQVDEVLFGKNGVAEGLQPGKIVIDMSSISPIATKEFARRIEGMGCAYLDAPVSGGQIGARDGTLSIMVGGAESVFEKAKPLFEAMGKTITLLGGNGDGQTAKIANQIIVALNLEATAEALLFAAKAGADPRKVHKALLGGFAYSKIFEVHGERMINRTFAPGFRVELHQKDLNNALSSARALGMPLPNTAVVQELFNSCVAHGGKAWDHSALVRTLEKLANFEIGQ